MGIRVESSSSICPSAICVLFLSYVLGMEPSTQTLIGLLWLPSLLLLLIDRSSSDAPISNARERKEREMMMIALDESQNYFYSLISAL